jgi:hypothetical protein
MCVCTAASPIWVNDDLWLSHASAPSNLQLHLPLFHSHGIKCIDSSSSIFYFLPNIQYTFVAFTCSCVFLSFQQSDCLSNSGWQVSSILGVVRATEVWNGLKWHDTPSLSCCQNSVDQGPVVSPVSTYLTSCCFLLSFSVLFNKTNYDRSLCLDKSPASAEGGSCANLHHSPSRLHDQF